MLKGTKDFLGHQRKLVGTTIGLILAVMSFPAWAQGTPSILLGPGATSPCFDVVPMTDNAVPYGPIMINRCTGVTWLLVRENVFDTKGNPTGKFAFRWHPLSSAGNEAIFGLSNPPGSSSTPAVEFNAPANKPNTGK